MTTANKITNVDLVSRAKGLLLNQFKDKTNINKIVDILVSQVQELDNTLINLQEVRRLDNAHGIYLDNIGERLKVTRTSLDDDDYRTAIKVRMLKNKSRGTLKEVEDIISLMTYNLPHYIENTNPYVVELSAYLACLNTPAGLELIKELFPVNVGVRVMNTTSTPFGFEGNSNAKGFSSTANMTVEGQITSLVSSFFGASDDSRFVARKDVLIVPPPVDTVAILPTSKPANRQSPFVSPTESIYEGTILTCSQGTWLSLTDITYTYQWFRGGDAIGGATTNTYTVVEEDLEELVSCNVIATNINGQNTAISNSVLPSADTPVTAGLLPNLGITQDFFGYEMNNQEALLQLTFTPNGEVVVNASPSDVFSFPFLDVVGAGVASGFEIQYNNLSGSPLNTPTQLLWLPLSTNQFFTMSVDSTIRDKGGRQVFRVRRISDQVMVEGSCYISVTSNSFTDPIPF
jgi:hypothetical protein